MIQSAITQKTGVEVIGPWLHNKGDVLNIHSVTTRLSSQFKVGVTSNLGLDAFPEDPPLYRIERSPTCRELLSAAKNSGLKRSLSLAKTRIHLATTKSEELEATGVLNGKDVTGLIDCSGFAYGDQWNPRRAYNRANYYAKLRKAGAKLVLLPQAFGPFEKAESIKANTAALSQFHLVFARDPVSFDYLKKLDLGDTEIELAPDITHLLQPNRPRNAEQWSNRVCIVPNERMLDRTTDSEGEHYMALMRTSVAEVKKAGYEPCFVLHETNDRPMVERINDSLPEKLEIYDDDALTTKGYLGASFAVIGSRYHALLSSLSQGTPCLGTSWNHKYEAMFSDYMCSDMVLRENASPAQIHEKIQRLLQERADLNARLLTAAQIQKQSVEAMWQRVESLLNQYES